MKKKLTATFLSSLLIVFNSCSHNQKSPSASSTTTPSPFHLAASYREDIPKRSKIKIKKWGTLLLNKETSDRHIAHFSAASGILMSDKTILVAADDENSLGLFANKLPLKGDLITIIAGDLPADTAARKKVKTDWEALLHIEGHVLMIPSGSTPDRMKGAIAKWNESSTLNTSLSEIKIIDFAPLYQHFKKDIKQLNIEGTSANNDTVYFFNRGNGSEKENALIMLDKMLFLQWARSGQWPEKEMVRLVNRFDIGSRKGVDLSFSDAVVLNNGNILFIASAEDTPNAFTDGEILGSGIGLLVPAPISGQKAFQINWLAPLSKKIKAEGLAVKEGEKSTDIFVATDGDDPKNPGEIYHFNLKNIELQ